MEDTKELKKSQKIIQSKFIQNSQERSNLEFNSKTNSELISKFSKDKVDENLKYKSTTPKVKKTIFKKQISKNNKNDNNKEINNNDNQLERKSLEENRNKNTNKENILEKILKINRKFENNFSNTKNLSTNNNKKTNDSFFNSSNFIRISEQKNHKNNNSNISNISYDENNNSIQGIVEKYESNLNIQPDNSMLDNTIENVNYTYIEKNLSVSYESVNLKEEKNNIEPENNFNHKNFGRGFFTSKLSEIKEREIEDTGLKVTKIIPITKGLKVDQDDDVMNYMDNTLIVQEYEMNKNNFEEEKVEEKKFQLEKDSEEEIQENIFLLDLNLPSSESIYKTEKSENVIGNSTENDSSKKKECKNFKEKIEGDSNQKKLFEDLNYKFHDFNYYEMKEIREKDENSLKKLYGDEFINSWKNIHKDVFYKIKIGILKNTYFKNKIYSIDSKNEINLLNKFNFLAELDIYNKYVENINIIKKNVDFLDLDDIISISVDRTEKKEFVYKNIKNYLYKELKNDNAENKKYAKKLYDIRHNSVLKEKINFEKISIDSKNIFDIRDIKFFKNEVNNNRREVPLSNEKLSSIFLIRESLPDGNSFYRMFMFNLFENLILNKKLKLLAKIFLNIIFVYEDYKNNNDNEFDKISYKFLFMDIDINEVKIIFNFIINFMRMGDYSKAYEFLIKGLNFPNGSLDKVI